MIRKQALLELYRIVSNFRPAEEDVDIKHAMTLYFAQSINTMILKIVHIIEVDQEKTDMLKGKAMPAWAVQKFITFLYVISSSTPEVQQAQGKLK